MSPIINNKLIFSNIQHALAYISIDIWTDIKVSSHFFASKVIWIQSICEFYKLGMSKVRKIGMKITIAIHTGKVKYFCTTIDIYLEKNTEFWRYWHSVCYWYFCRKIRVQNGIKGMKLKVSSSWDRSLSNSN